METSQENTSQEIEKSNLKAMRLNSGKKSYEMAEKLNISKTFYSLLENRRKRPSIDLARRMASVWNVDLITILRIFEMA